MGNHPSAIQKCLTSAVGGDASLLTTSSSLLYQFNDVKPYNLDIPITPAAVTYPESAEQVAAIVKCAADAKLKVQPRCGGHSYGNYGIGGTNGAIVVDLKHFQQFSMDNSTWTATIGGGTLLNDVTKRLHAAGGRAMAHGTCPQVGIGGHATIGGLGPTSRMWGSALDHVEEVEVVLANSSIIRASATENSDVLFALKGAGASFGIITEFKVRTEAEPSEVVQYNFNFNLGSTAAKADVFKAWQSIISDPDLSRKFASQFIVFELGTIVYGTYFGSKEEFNSLNITSRLPGNGNASTIVLDDWLGVVGQWADEVGQQIGGGIPSNFYSKSLAFTKDDLIPDDGVDALFEYFDKTDKGTAIWFAIFDLSGGAVSDVHMNATAFSLRNTLFYVQTYAIDLGRVTTKTRSFISGINKVVLDALPGHTLGAYPGYVDPALPNAQQAYWGANLQRLTEIKRAVDPGDVFHNPQSVPVAK
ncbi:putative glucooligosaccharide oxidase [Lophium mytilinum]|uniref:Putative glucooligosaccharide oxidase n=1 Tax=Lophium mytilinum TaxID=390894 RepID=A0A6A6QVK2_9PEZI|nr:putative glucooligosaccharide oxidase [Lophium mytilinum]